MVGEKNTHIVDMAGFITDSTVKNALDGQGYMVGRCVYDISDNDPGLVRFKTAFCAFMEDKKTRQVYIRIHDTRMLVTISLQPDGMIKLVEKIIIDSLDNVSVG